MKNYNFKRRVKYYETDAMKIVHHSNYIKWLEEARVELFRENGVSYKKLEELGIYIPVLEVKCKYEYPCTFDDEIEIIFTVKEITGVKFTCSYIINNLSTQKEVLKAETKHCFVNENMKPINIKKFDSKTYDVLESYLSK